jgi:glycosyltransferase involved in cell wall biosynthesis
MTAEGPLVSIGIPVYNGEDSISRALDSLLMQTYDNLELIISDNASTDRTSQICKEYASKDSRIKYYRNPRNLGVYANYRRVVALAAGEYFTWAAVDDLRPPGAIESCVNALSVNNRAVMAHGIVLVRAPGEDELVQFPNAVQANQKNAGARIRLFTRGIDHNGMVYGLYRLNALKQVTFGNHMGQDYLVCLQICLFGEIEYVEAPVIIVRYRRPAPKRVSMYEEVPITLRSLLAANKLRRRKCWTVLLMGSYYLATRRNVSFAERFGAVAAHMGAFWGLYRSRLRKEICFQVFQPIGWFINVTWRLTIQWSVTACLTRRVTERFIGSRMSSH